MPKSPAGILLSSTALEKNQWTALVNYHWGGSYSHFVIYLLLTVREIHKWGLWSGYLTKLEKKKESTQCFLNALTVVG